MSADQPQPAAMPDVPAYAPELWPRSGQDTAGRITQLSRAEQAALTIARAASGLPVGARLGSKEDIRVLCGVSVGTVNEAIKLAQERRVITSRPGPGGGLFVADPTPLARMNGWFRNAEGHDALSESIQIRDALAPLIITEVLTRITDVDLNALRGLVDELRRAGEAHDVAPFIQAAWDVHEYVAGIGGSKLLDSLYLSIMDVGTSHLRAVLRDADDLDPARLRLDRLAVVVEDLVTALAARDRDAAIDALRRTDPTMILRDAD